MSDNVFPFKGGKDQDGTEIPVHDYVIIDVEDEEWDATGFMIFTSHHVAVMRDSTQGAVPVLVLPINRVKAATIADDSGV